MVSKFAIAPRNTKLDINCTGSAVPRRALGSFLEQSYGAAFGVLLGVGVPQKRAVENPRFLKT